MKKRERGEGGESWVESGREGGEGQRDIKKKKKPHLQSFSKFHRSATISRILFFRIAIVMHEESNPGPIVA